MEKVRDKLDQIDERLNEIERTYDILLSIAKEFYESNERQRQPNRHRSYEKRHRANQDGYFGDQEHPERDGGEVCDESGVSDIPSGTRSYWNGGRWVFSKFCNGQTVPMKWLLLSLLIYLLLALIIRMTIDIPFLGYYKVK